MSGELYGLAGPDQRRYQTPPPTADQGSGTDLATGVAQQFVRTLLGNADVDVPADDPFGFLAALLGIRWDKMDSFEDGQLALLDRVDLLSPLQDFGSCYAPGSGDLINLGKVPFSKQVGPMDGCQLVNAGIVLNDKGLWEICVRLAFSYTIGGGGIGWEIRTYAPGGGGSSGIFSVQRDYVVDSQTTMREITTTVVVPDPGYRVEVWITTLVLGRATTGGPENNRFSVKHITRSAVNPI
ncbi:hypothetical protein [Gordonia sp. SND2]|uniref:hypothetical protein n=1 Tax=Gordonia sp. SND2 TaxID=3388659 RepID=UPI00398B235A